MFKTIFNSLFAVSLFALGAVGSWYLSQMQADKQAAEMGDSIEDLQSMDVSATEGTLDAVDSAEEAAPKSKPPIPLRPKQMTPEELFRFSIEMKEIAKQQQEKQEELTKMEFRLKLIEKEMEGRQRESDEILKQTEHSLDESEKLVAQIQQELEKVVKEKDELQTKLEKLKRSSDIPEDDVKTNIKELAGILTSQAPDAAAENVKRLANDGKLDVVVRMFKSLEEKKVAKILDALNDPVLYSDITEAYLQLQKEKPNNQ